MGFGRKAAGTVFWSGAHQIALGDAAGDAVRRSHESRTPRATLDPNDKISSYHGELHIYQRVNYIPRSRWIQYQPIDHASLWWGVWSPGISGYSACRCRPSCLPERVRQRDRQASARGRAKQSSYPWTSTCVRGLYHMTHLSHRLVLS
jgi:hypothetical protein